MGFDPEVSPCAPTVEGAEDNLGYQDALANANRVLLPEPPPHSRTPGLPDGEQQDAVEATGKRVVVAFRPACELLRDPPTSRRIQLCRA
jgi:hypothetical protein